MNAVHPEEGVAIDLSARTKLRITGADRLRYLNGQVSNDVRKASETAAVHACVLTVKGKISADIFIRAEGESLCVDSDAEREELIARLERYVIADDVQIADITDEFGLFHLLGQDARSLAASERALDANRYGMSGVDVWIPSDRHDLFSQRITSETTLLGADAEEAFRIERGIPRWGRELTEEIIPAEANLQGSAIDYAKGCYIGQEVISRIKMSGQTNKRLCGLIANADAPLQSGMKLWTREAEAKEIGWLTSATRSERVGAQIALAFLKRGYQDVGLQLSARGSDGRDVPVAVAALPFV